MKEVLFSVPPKPTVEPYIGKLERFELFSTNQCYYLVGCNKQNTAYRVLKMDRTLIERPSDSIRPGETSPNSKHANRHSMNHSSTSINSRSTFDMGAGDRESNMDRDNPSMAAQMADNSHTAKPTLRPLSDFLTEDPNVYSQEEIKDMLDMIHDGNRMSRSDGKQEEQSGGLKPIVKAYGIVGFIRFLDCYYLTLTTRRAKVGSIGDNGIFTIKNTETVPLKPAERRPGSDDNADPSSVLLSMWNRGKRSVGLGLTNREIAELRYQGLYQVVDLTKNFYFSYTYDVTRSLQENFLTSSSKPFPPPPFKDMYVWNFFLTREFESCLDATTRYYWIMPIIHGAFVQRKVNDYGRYLNIALIARRSRHFAGTRYLKRGVNEQGQVANDVEHEQILHDESLAPPGNFSSYLQVRGSIPTFWTQESSVTMPKPPIELNRVDLTYNATQLHFGDLFRRYSSPILVLDLVKQSEKREREVRVGNEFRHAIDYCNRTIDDANKIRYCALDYSHISKHRNLDVSYALNEVVSWAVNQTGFFCSDPKWKIEDTVVAPFTDADRQVATRLTEQLQVPFFPMEQNGVLRTNCIDCLDRTNVAQFSAGVEAMGQQLVVMGIRSKGKLGPSSSIVRVLIDLYVDIGDSIALQYGGSEAHKKVTAGVTESNITGPIGKHKELLTSIRRYYSNAFTDRLKQDAMNLFLGYYLPFRHPVPLWEMENDFYLHNFHTSGLVTDSVGRYGRLTSMKTYQRAFGIDWREDEEQADGDAEPSSFPFLAVSRQQPDTMQRTPCAIAHSSQSWEHESKRVERVRHRCKEQHAALSVWWKVALQTNLRERLWARLGKSQDDSLLPGRFERVYQPEKLSQFDRFFSRTWETPVRRTHAAQHSEGIDDEDAAVAYSRVISTDFASARRPNEAVPLDVAVRDEMKLSEFVNEHGFAPRDESSLKVFSRHFIEPHAPEKFEYITQLDASRLQNPPDEYARYCAPAKQTFDHYDQSRVEEFKRELRDYTLSSDDVTGIRQLAQSAHIGDRIAVGEYRGLHKHVSAIEVATAIQEQLNMLESLPSTGMSTIESELGRRGFETKGVKDSVTHGRNRCITAEKSYREIVEARVSRCQRSALSTADSMQLYVSQFDGDTLISAPDRIFLQAIVQSKEEARTVSPRRSNSDTSSFIEKAANLGIHITPHECRSSAVPPPLYQSDSGHEVSVGFEQINEDMFSRKDNKFMVFNRAGVDSWKGSKPITKISQSEDILRSTLA